MLLPLGFQPGDVDVGGALGFATFAGQTELHDFGDLGVIPRIGGGVSVGEDIAERVGAGAGRIPFVARGHEARAHGAAHEVGFPTVADSRAFLGGTEHALRRTEIKNRFVVGRRMVRRMPQRRVHRRRVDDLAGIEYAVRIKGVFHALHHRVAGLADHELDELPAQPTVAVLAAERATVFFHEDGDIGRDVAEHLQALGRF